jgi:Uma2 family endonuclease
MTALIVDPDMVERLIAERRATGQDKYDEVWDGVYVMSPMANPEHQDVVGELTAIFIELVRRKGLGTVHPGGNVSGEDDDWTKDYRCPDVLVFLKGNPAERRDAYWYGGPDLAVEVVSVGDRSHEKLPFYAKVNTREVLIVDRRPWALTLYRNRQGTMVEIGRSTADNHSRIVSEVVPVSFEMSADDSGRPQIEVRHLTDANLHWTIRPGA